MYAQGMPMQLEGLPTMSSIMQAGRAQPTAQLQPMQIQQPFLAGSRQAPAQPQAQPVVQPRAQLLGAAQPALAQPMQYIQVQPSMPSYAPPPAQMQYVPPVPSYTPPPAQLVAQPGVTTYVRPSVPSYTPAPVVQSYTPQQVASYATAPAPASQLATYAAPPTAQVMTRDQMAPQQLATYTAASAPAQWSAQTSVPTVQAAPIQPEAVAEYLLSPQDEMVQRTLASDTNIMVLPYYLVKDMDAFLEVCNQAVEVMKNEHLCNGFGFCIGANPMGTMAFCRGSFANADGVLSHFHILENILRDGLCKYGELTSLQIHGPSEELDRLRSDPMVQEMNAEFYDLLPSSFEVLKASGDMFASQPMLMTNQELLMQQELPMQYKPVVA